MNRVVIGERGRRLRGATALVASLVMTTSLTIVSVASPEPALAACGSNHVYQTDNISYTTADAGRMTWIVRNLWAPDYASGGFASQVLWVGTDGLPVQSAWVEVGATHGWQGQNINTYYSAHQTTSGTYAETRFASLTLSWGQVSTFTVQPVSNGTYTGIVYNGSSTSQTYWSSHYPTSASMAAGSEVTCADARVDRVYVSQNQYRNASTQVWANATNGSLVPSSGGGIAWCSQPVTFRYWHNSAIGTTLCS